MKEWVFFVWNVWNQNSWVSWFMGLGGWVVFFSVGWISSSVNHIVNNHHSIQFIHFTQLWILFFRFVWNKENGSPPSSSTYRWYPNVSNMFFCFSSSSFSSFGYFGLNCFFFWIWNDSLSVCNCEWWLNSNSIFLRMRIIHSFECLDIILHSTIQLKNCFWGK